MKHIQCIETILYVTNQQASAEFYERIFRKKADLNVAGMTEFRFSDYCKLGLMPSTGIVKILADKTPHPDKGNGIPRCELYFYVDNVRLEYDNAIKAGAILISAIEDRDWGDRACYFADLDGHIIAFAEKLDK